MRRPVYFTLVTVTTVSALALLAIVFLKHGITPLALLMLILYALLMLWVSTSFWTATIGFFLLLRGGDRHGLASHANLLQASQRPANARTALVMPIYNEDSERVFAGLRAIWQAVQNTGRGAEFDLFVLSDTRDPDTWVEEEVQWYRMCQDFNAHGHVFYRNREFNTARKSGNIEDFVSRWGGHYRYMIVLDADSLMGGSTITRMVDLMEANPTVALLQSPPLPVNRESLFSRILQFASNLYGGMFVTGLCYWQMSDGNYWGHNAIIRIEPFAKHCGLPKLSGQEPFGGEILSHDFVEAALLRRAGWEVWLEPTLHESYEELPPTLIDYAKRDRRWCQGNMQHMRMLFARGFDGISRLHMLMGIMSYLSSPLWFVFLVVTGIETYVQAQTSPVYFFGDNLFPVWPESYAVEMTTVLVVTLTMLFLPKIFGLLLLFRYPGELRKYGGLLRASLSILLEIVFSVLVAPVLMLYQSKFVLAILLRRTTGWPAQQRDDHRLGLREAIAAHGGHTAMGVLAGYLSYTYVPDFLLWFTPVLAGFLLSIPVSIMTSSIDLGRRLRKWGLFLTPQESEPPEVIRLLKEQLPVTQMQTDGQGYRGAKRVVVDPAVNALHLALLPERTLTRRHRYYLRMLIYQLLEDGPDSLTLKERRSLISDPETLCLMHMLAWSVEEIDPAIGRPRLVESL